MLLLVPGDPQRSMPRGMTAPEALNNSGLLSKSTTSTSSTCTGASKLKMRLKACSGLVGTEGVQ